MNNEKEMSSKESQNKEYEYDMAVKGELTDLGLEDDLGQYKEVLNASEYQKNMKYGVIDYYEELMNAGKDILIQFTSLRGTKLRAVYGNVELVYDVADQHFGRVTWEETADVLDKEYRLSVSEVDRENERVILKDSASDESNRLKALKKINEMLAEGKEIYLDGQIVALQRESGSEREGNAAYINIKGLGIKGVLPIHQWSTGFVSHKEFQEKILSNIGSKVKFKVNGISKIAGKGDVYVCSRKDFMNHAGLDVWKIIDRTFEKKDAIVVKMIERSNQEYAVYGAIDGIEDFNVLCFMDARAKMKFSDLKPGRYYRGYVQSKDREKRRLRVRLLEPIDRKRTFTDVKEEQR